MATCNAFSLETIGSIVAYRIRPYRFSTQNTTRACCHITAINSTTPAA